MSQPADRLDRLGGALFVVLGGVEYDVPDHPARRWIEAVVRDGYDQVLPGLLHPDDAAPIYEQLAGPSWDLETDEDEEDDGLTILDLRAPALELETAAAGRPWWEAHRLVVIALDSWEAFDGWCAEKQLTPMELPYDRFLNLVLRWVLLNTPQKDHDDFYYRLREAPRTNPADLGDNPEWDQQEADGFMAALGMAGGASGR